MTGRTPDWLVERLHAGDLPPGEAARVRARLAAEGGLPRLGALERDDAAFAAAHPPGPALGEIRRRARGTSRRARPVRWLLPAAAALAAAAVVAVVGLPLRPGPDGTRLKGPGAARLTLHRQRPGGGTEALAPGAQARAGDLLQLTYVAGAARFGVILSVDGRGAVTLHWPEAGGQAAELLGGRAVPLSHAYRLDDAPAFERFFLVTGPEPFPAEAALEAARRLAASGQARTDPLPLPAGLSQRDFLVAKEGR